jgi:hypothetical protein
MVISRETAQRIAEILFMAFGLLFVLFSEFVWRCAKQGKVRPYGR